MNQQLLLFIHGWRGEWIDRAMLLATTLGDALNGLIVLVILAVIWRRQSERWLAYAAAYTLFVLSSNAGKHLVAETRPFNALPDLVHPVGYLPDSYSFPSGHAGFAAMLAVSLWPWTRPWQRALLVTFAFVVGFSRVNLGVHYPLDVLGGWLFGIAAGVGGLWLARRVQSPM